jgi:hypothetical protein
MGEVPDFSVNISKETLAFYSSRSGIKTKSLEVLRELASSFQFSCAEFAKETLALAVLGTITAANQTGSSVTDESIKAFQDRWVELAKRKVSSVVVTGTGGSPVYVLNTDYKLETEEGLIMALSTGSIANEATILVDYSYASLTQNIIKAMQDHKIQGALKFVGDPDQGPDIVIDLWKSNLMPAGEIGMISDDWATFQLQAEVQKDETNHPTEPYFRVTHIGG